MTKRESAVGYFKEMVRRIPLNRDHSNMCKFRSAQDDDFLKLVAFWIYRDMVESSTPDQALAVDLQSMYPGDDRVPGRTLLQVSSHGGPPGLLRRQSDPYTHGPREFTVIEQKQKSSTKGSASMKAPVALASPSLIAQKLGLIDFTRSTEVRAAYDTTCDWILKREVVRTWHDGDQSSILFIRGGQGMGKSVLSRFLVEHLRTSFGTDNNVVVVSFFCKQSGRRSRPESILQHVLYHLCIRFPEATLEAAGQRERLQGNRPTFTYYWDLFTAIRSKIQFKLFYVIDGLDECINERRRDDHEIDRELLEFLRSLCQELTDNASQNLGIVKLLLTTRPVKEVALVSNEYQNLVYSIRPTDVYEGVSTMIEKDISDLAAKKGLTAEAEDLIKIDLKAKAGAMYHWARAAYMRLSEININTNVLESIKDELETFRPGDIDAIYHETLRGLRRDAELSANNKSNKGIVATILQFLVFGESELNLEILRYAIASLATIDATNEEFMRYRPTSVSLASTIENTCGNLINVEKDQIQLAHDSVRSFLLRLDPVEWPEFSCKDSDQGQMVVLLACLQFLTLWYSLDLDADPEISNSDRSWAYFGLGFVGYATCFWDVHARKIKNPALYKGILLPFLTGDNNNFQYMQIARAIWRETYSDDWTPAPVSTFLASADLGSIIESGSLKTQSVKRSWPSVLRFRRKPYEAKLPVIDVSEVDYEGNTMLHYAARNGSIDLLNFLLRNGARGEELNKDGRTPFAMALAVNSEEIALRLIQVKQAYLETASDKNISSFQFVAYHGLTRTLTWFFDQDIPVDDYSGFLGWTPLYVASQYGKLDIVEQLLDKKANASSGMKDGSTPLHAAARTGNTNILRRLFEKRKDLDPTPIDEEKRTPLFFASYNGHLDAFEELYSRKSDVAPESEDWLPIHAAAFSGSLPITRHFPSEQYTKETNEGWLPLHIAARGGHLPIVEFYLDRYIDIDAKALDFQAKSYTLELDARVVTPIHLATINNRTEVVHALLRRGADTRTRTVTGSTLVHLAAVEGNKELLEEFLAKGLRPFDRDETGFAPFHLAALKGHDSVVDVFLRLLEDNTEFELDAPVHNGLTAFHLAIISGSKGLVEKLLARGADDKRTDELGNTSIMLAAALEETDILELLIDRGQCDINATNRYGNTALHKAAVLGRLTALKLLIAKGADVKAATVLDETPLLYATTHLHEDVVRDLLLAHADPAFADRSGLTVADHAWDDKHPLFSIFASPNTTSPSLDLMTKETIQIKTIRELFKLRGNEKPLSFQNQWQDHQLFAYQLKYLGKEEEARICLETQLTPMRDGTTLFKQECFGCKQDRVKGSLSVCWECYMTFLCESCYRKRKEGEDVVKSCSTSHKYFAIGGDGWKSLPRGKVKKEGDKYITMDEWMQTLERKYCEGESPVIETMTQNVADAIPNSELSAASIPIIRIHENGNANHTDRDEEQAQEVVKQITSNGTISNTERHDHAMSNNNLEEQTRSS